MPIPLGRLHRVSLRDAWLTEASDFTPWLAHRGNLEILADTLNMDLELESQEKNVGPFRADMLCKNTDNGSWVLIENQPERTDHTHLGQLMTYAAGLQAVTIIWIAARFTDQHRAALDWLNDITDESFRFFGLEVELWRIGESPAAPKFNIISKPNDWTRTVGRTKRLISEELTPIRRLQMEFWQGLKDLIEDSGSPIRMQKPFPQHWANVGIGRTGFSLTPLVNTRDNSMAVELLLNDTNSGAYFKQLLNQKPEIEQAVGQELVWHELEGRISSRITLSRSDCDPTETSRWPEYHAWLKEKLELFDRVFRERIRGLTAHADQPA